VRALSSPHAAIPPLAVRCLAQLSTMRLSTFDSSTGALARRIMALLKDCPRADAQLSQDCLKLLNNLLKRHAAFTPTDAQFRFIVRFAFSDLEETHREEQRSTVFSLMRAVLARRPLLPEIYDTMNVVSGLVVRANADETRRSCAGALVQFLLDYPLGERRLRTHLESLAANFEYVHAAGRVNALRCARDVVARFPKDVVDANAVFLFVPLVARLGADEDAECRAAAGEALRVLLKRTAGGGVGEKLLDLATRWCAVGGGGAAVGDDAERLRRAAMQTLGIAVAASPSHASRAVAAARHSIVSALAEHDPAVAHREEDDDDVAVNWQTCYRALLLVEKAHALCPEALEGDECDDGDEDASEDSVWRASQALLSHRHQWVQHAAARVIGRYLAVNGAAIAAALARRRDGSHSDDAAEYAYPVNLETIARACVAVLEQGVGARAVDVDEKLAEQTVKNLTFAAVVLLQTRRPIAENDDENDEEDEEALEADDDEDDENDLNAAAQTAAAKEKKKKTTTTTEDDAVDAKPPLPWLFRRVGKVGAGGIGASRAAALRWTAALAASLGEEGFDRHPTIAPPLLLPSVLCADDAVVGVAPEHRAIAEETLEVLRGAMRGELFSRAHAATRARIASRRDARRRAKALDAVVDPERAARARIAKAAKRTAARKRKVQERRAGKGSSGSAKKRAREL